MFRVEIAYPEALPPEGFFTDRRVCRAIGGAVRSSIKRRVTYDGLGVTQSGLLFSLWPNMSRRRMFPRGGSYHALGVETSWGDFSTPLQGGERRGPRWAYYPRGYQEVRERNVRKVPKGGMKRCTYTLTGTMWRDLKVRAWRRHALLYFRSRSRDKAARLQRRPKGHFFGYSSRERAAAERAMVRQLNKRLGEVRWKVRKTKGYRGQPRLTWRQAQAIERAWEEMRDA